MVLVEATVEPTLGQSQRLCGILLRSITRRALVESHHNVGTDGTLGVDDALGGEEVARSVDMRLEVATLLLQLATRRKRKDLETTAVGEHRLIPRRETVYTTRLLQNFHSGAEVEVIGICEYNLCLRLIANITMKDALHSRCGAHRHKDRGLNDTVIGNYFTRTRVCCCVLML